MNDIATELAKLHDLSGADFIHQLRLIVSFREFQLIEGETDIYSAIGEDSEDFQSLLNAARKAVSHGYRVFILPNPKGIRTADFIFERKGVYKMFDLKTISGKSVAGSRLIDSIGQANRVLLNMTSDYSPAALARNIKMYFESSNEALEVLIFKGKKMLSVTRDLTLSSEYYNIFMKRYIR
jgi:hypothetical protein